MVSHMPPFDLRELSPSIQFLLHHPPHDAFHFFVLLATLPAGHPSFHALVRKHLDVRRCPQRNSFFNIHFTPPHCHPSCRSLLVRPDEWCLFRALQRFALGVYQCAAFERQLGEEAEGFRRSLTRGDGTTRLTRPGPTLKSWRNRRFAQNLVRLEKPQPWLL